MTKPYVHAAGYWLSGEEGHFSEGQGYFFDAALASELALLLEGMSVCDIGCGLGKYVQWLRNRKFDCDGYDGNPNTRELTRGLCDTLNFAEPVRLNRQYDAIMSFEVGEHIPEEFEASFIENIASHARKLVVLSWAVPGQAGDGHVNCRSNFHIIRQFSRRGFRFEPVVARMLRANCSLYWFKHTLMVFSRRQMPYSLSEWTAWCKIMEGDLDRLKLSNRSNSPILQAAAGKLVRTWSELNANRRRFVNGRRILRYNGRSSRISDGRSGNGLPVSFFAVCFAGATDFNFLRLSVASLCHSTVSVTEIHVYSDPSDPFSRSQMGQLQDECSRLLVFRSAEYGASIDGPQVMLNQMYACEHLLSHMPDNAYLVNFNADVLFVSGGIFQRVADSNLATVRVPYSWARPGRESVDGCYFVRARELRGIMRSRTKEDAMGIAGLCATLSGSQVSDTMPGQTVVAREADESIADGCGSCSCTNGAATSATIAQLSMTSSLVCFRDPQSRIVDKARMQLAANALLGPLSVTRNPYSELALRQG